MSVDASVTENDMAATLSPTAEHENFAGNPEDIENASVALVINRTASVVSPELMTTPFSGQVIEQEYFPLALVSTWMLTV